MKNLLLLIVMIISSSANSQVLDSIKMTPSEFVPVIVQTEGKTKNEIYAKVKSWINRTYKNPEHVLKADEVDSYIRIQGRSSFSFKYMGITQYDYDYTLEVEIKDGKYKYSISNIMLYSYPVPEYFYDKKGSLKTGKMYNRIREAFMADLNKNFYDLKDFISADTKSGW